VDLNDVLQTAVLGFSTVGNDVQFIQSVLDKLVNFVERLEIAEVVGQDIRVDHW